MTGKLVPCTRGAVDPLRRETYDDAIWLDRETGRSMVITEACPDCGHVIALHPSVGNPSLDACVVCVLLVQFGPQA